MNDVATRPAETQPPDGMVPCARCDGLSLRSRVLEAPPPRCLLCGHPLDLTPPDHGTTDAHHDRA